MGYQVLSGTVPGIKYIIRMRVNALIKHKWKGESFSLKTPFKFFFPLTVTGILIAVI